MDPEIFLSLLQFTDGLFPMGSYAHSLGLETYVAEGTIRDAKGVEHFLLSFLQGAAAPTDAVAALSSWRAALSGRSAKQQCIIIDHSLEAMKLASELRDASRQMGRQMLRIAVNLGGPFAVHGLTADLFSAVQSEETHGHHAMVFGVIAAALGWQERETACAFLYSSCAGLVAAALRLLPLGQVAGQQILWTLAPYIAKVAGDIQGKEMVDIWSFTPGIEIAAMRHAKLDARLFRS
jgi:urease accessory protein